MLGVFVQHGSIVPASWHVESASWKGRFSRRSFGDGATGTSWPGPTESEWSSRCFNKVARSRRDLVLVSNWLTGDSKRTFWSGSASSPPGRAIISYGSVQLETAAERYGFQLEAAPRAATRRRALSGTRWRPPRRTSSAPLVGGPGLPDTYR